MAEVPDTTEVVAAELHYQDDRHENCERVCVRRARQAIAADRKALADAGYTVVKVGGEPAELCRFHEHVTGRMPSQAELSTMLLARDAIFRGTS